MQAKESTVEEGRHAIIRRLSTGIMITKRRDQCSLHAGFGTEPQIELQATVKSQRTYTGTVPKPPASPFTYSQFRVIVNVHTLIQILRSV